MKKKVYLFCTHGMSTSMLAKKMQDVADAHQMPVEVEAFSHALISQIVEEKHPDVIMLGPQVKYLYNETVEQFGATGAPIVLIGTEDYGMMNGEKVLKQAILALKKKKEQGV